jgi:hypothetical protein
MGEFAHWYQDGGVFMRFILLLGLSGAALGLIAALRRQRTRAWLALGVAALCLGIGVVGWQLGLVEMRDALATVAPDYHAEVIARGTAIAVVPLQFAMICGAPALLGGLVALVRGEQIRGR